MHNWLRRRLFDSVGLRFVIPGIARDNCGILIMHMFTFAGLRFDVFDIALLM